MEYIVIPMLGKSKRFKKQDKATLEVNGKTIFMHAMTSIVDKFKKSKWVFIINSKTERAQIINFINENKLDAHFEFINEETSGQAESVYVGMRFLNEDAQLYIFNIDTMISDFKLSDNCSTFYTFKSNKPNLSYVCPNTKVVNEKENITGLASCGLYSFETLKLFNLTYKKYSTFIKQKYGETYIAPMFNHIDFEISNVKNVTLLGTPEEVDEYERKTNRE